MSGDTPQDLIAATRDALLERHIIHDFKRQRVVENLRGCYGRLMSTVYREMLHWIVGRRVIDCGCGFGQFSRIAIDAGFDVVSLDIDDDSLEIAREISQIQPIKESVYATSLAARSRDTAVCCDSIQHFDIGYFVPEMRRLGVRRVIIYDSNFFNPVLGCYRFLTGHKESNDRTSDQIIAEFEGHGFEAVVCRFENIISLPTSGGFQRAPLPLLSQYPAAIAMLDRWLVRAARLVRFDRWITFRFLIVLDLRQG